MNLGIGEIIVVLAVAFLVVGPKDLPKIARALARGLRKVKGLYADLKGSLSLEGELDEVKKTVRSADPGGELREETAALRRELDALRGETPGRRD